ATGRRNSAAWQLPRLSQPARSRRPRYARPGCGSDHRQRPGVRARGDGGAECDEPPLRTAGAKEAVEPDYQEGEERDEGGKEVAPRWTEVDAGRHRRQQVEVEMRQQRDPENGRAPGEEEVCGRPLCCRALRIAVTAGEPRGKWEGEAPAEPDPRSWLGRTS